MSRERELQLAPVGRREPEVFADTRSEQRLAPRDEHHVEAEVVAAATTVTAEAGGKRRRVAKPAGGGRGGRKIKKEVASVTKGLLSVSGGPWCRLGIACATRIFAEARACRERTPGAAAASRRD